MARNFRKPKIALQESQWLRECTPRNTQNSTKWSVKTFEDWQMSRENKIAKKESIGFPCESIEKRYRI